MKMNERVKPCTNCDNGEMVVEKWLQVREPDKREDRLHYHEIVVWTCTDCGMTEREDRGTCEIVPEGTD